MQRPISPPSVSGWLYPTAFSCWGDEERAAIACVLASGRLTQGAQVEAFEAEFAAYHGRKHGVMVNSGSSANLVAVAAMHHLRMIKPGQTAIVPAIAWSTTYAPLVQYGLDLRIVDVDESWNANPQKLRDINDVSLIVACSVLGNPADLPTWESAAGVLDIPLLEDNCESLGAVALDGRRCGTFGLASTFSFFYSHQISAIEGGMILTDEWNFAESCRLLRAHGWTRDLHGIPLSLKFALEYDFHGYGYNVRGLELHAAIAREQLRKLPRFTAMRQANAAVFRALTVDLPIAHPYENGTANPFGLAFMLHEPARRDALAAALRAASIDCRMPTGGSFTRHPYGQRWAQQTTPEADAIHDGGLFLGNGPLDLAEQIYRAVAVMREVLL